MTVFVSCSIRDTVAVRALAEHLAAAGEDVWLDDSPRGDAAWWSQTLGQIRSCSVFVVAVTNDALRSKRCRAELEYATALRLPIVPVLIGDVDSYRLDPIFTVQLVDYRKPDAAAGISLITALRGRAGERVALPTPLPEPPPIPYEFLTRLAATLKSVDPLTPAVQESTLAGLRRALRSEDDESVRGEVRELLHALRRRPEITHDTASELDEFLSADTEESRDLGAGMSGRRHASEASRWWRRPRNVVGAGVLVIVAAVVGYLVFEPPPPHPAPKGHPVSVAELDGLLLSAAEINAATGNSTLAIWNTFGVAADSSTFLADAACLFADAPVEKNVYTASGFTGLVQQVLQEPGPGDQSDHTVVQAVAAFPSAGDAAAFFAASARNWQACANRSYHNAHEGRADSVWDVGDVANVGGTLSVAKAQQDAKGWTCQRALTVRNNVAVDVMSCRYSLTDSAVTIAQQIAAKIPNP